VTQDFEIDETQKDDSGTPRAALPGDGPEGAGEATPTIDGLVAQWRAELDGQTSIPATDVQDRLLDLWGALPENEARAEVERWLTETLARQLYQVRDITDRLDSVLSGS